MVCNSVSDDGSILEIHARVGAVGGFPALRDFDEHGRDQAEE